MAKYVLHEFDKDKVFTGEIIPSKVEHIKYNPYEKNTVGQTVIYINYYYHFFKTDFWASMLWIFTEVENP
jgi:hypothetical protein